MSIRAIVTLGAGVLAVVALAFMLASPSAIKADDAPQRLSKADLEKVVDYLYQQLLADPSEIAFSEEQIAEATGIEITEEQGRQIIPVLMAKMQNSTEGLAVLAKLQGNSSCAAPTSTAGACSAHSEGCTASCGASVAQANRCAEYGACSLYGDLSAASGDILDVYVKEKATDGASFTDLTLPRVRGPQSPGRDRHVSRPGGHADPAGVPGGPLLPTPFRPSPS